MDIKRYISLFVSNWYWFAISLLLTLSVAYGINRWSEKVYTVTSTLLIKDEKSSSLNDIFPGAELLRDQQNVINEIGILKSYTLNYKVMKELPEFNVVFVSVGKRGIAETRLYKDNPFLVRYDSLRYQTIGERINIKILSEEKYRLTINDYKKIEVELSFGERFDSAGYDFSIVPKPGREFIYDPELANRYFFFFVDPTSLANQYRSRLSVTPVEEDATLVTLSTSGFVPRQEVDYLNTLMDVYLRDGLDYKNKTAAQTLEFIEKQLVSIADSLEIAETKLEKFRYTNKLIDISREGLAIQNRLEQLDQEKSRLVMQKNYYDYLKEYIDLKNENEDIIAPSVMGVTDQLLVRFVDELSGLQKQKKQLSINLYEASGPLKAIEENIAEVRVAIRENISGGLGNTVRLIAEVDKKLDDIEAEIKRLPSTEREMINFQRQFDINNTVYTFLLEKRAEAGIARASNVPDNRIIDRAGLYSSSRIKPKERQNFIIAFILGLAIPLFLIMVIDYLNNKIIDAKDIEKHTSVPVIGYISHNSMKTEMPVAEKPGSTLSESFRSIRTNLKYFLVETKCPVISVSSTITSEGKTFVSANLATILSMSGKRVLLIGLDLRKPRIHRVFGIENNTGISNYLIGEAGYGEIIVKTQVENLWYVPSGPVPPNPAELIESAPMKEFIDEARKEFDVIVIDTPPVAIVTDALLVSHLTDFYLFVVRQRYTSRSTLELIENMYQKRDMKNIGIVLNDISLSGYYGYGLRYGYSMGYGYNYGYNYYSHNGKYGYSESAKGYYTTD